MNRTLIWQLALRYLRGKGSANAVPVLSRISMIAIAVCSAAMIIIFSVFNGLESTIKSYYKAFYPDIKVTTTRGKFFRLAPATLDNIKKISGVQMVSTAIEDHVSVSNSNDQKVLTLKGIDRNYLDVNNVRPYIKGDDTVSAFPPYTAIVGNSTMMELSANINNLYSYITLQHIDPSAANIELDPLSAISSLKLHPAGIFNIEASFNGNYIFAPLPLVQELFAQKDMISSIELTAESSKVEDVKSTLQQLLGNGYKVETRYEQNKSLYLIMGSEKWAIYAIMILVLLIASFNMVGSLSMLVLEKQKDLAILKAMGAQPSAIRLVFLLESVLWCLVGTFIGMLLGALIAFAQKQFGLVKMQGAFTIDNYPVELRATDFLLVFFTVLIIGLLAGIYPSRRAMNTSDSGLKSD